MKSELIPKKRKVVSFQKNCKTGNDDGNGCACLRFPSVKLPGRNRTWCHDCYRLSCLSQKRESRLDVQPSSLKLPSISWFRFNTSYSHEIFVVVSLSRANESSNVWRRWDKVMKHKNKITRRTMTESQLTVIQESYDFKSLLQITWLFACDFSSFFSFRPNLRDKRITMRVFMRKTPERISADTNLNSSLSGWGCVCFSFEVHSKILV
jgi:hypothetical protein